MVASSRNWTKGTKGTNQTEGTEETIRGQAPVSEGGIDFEGPWRDLGGNPKSHPL